MKYTIDQAIDERVRVFDFLRGSESYKAEWGARPELTSRLLLWHERAPSDLLESSAV
jgi:CelD/BcsL family acetyltransferase involved in cellulose biosynthesis